LTIDLGKSCMFNMVVIDHGPGGTGYAHQVTLLVSIDGTDFQPIHVSPGTRRITTLSVITPTLARYIRLEATEPGAQPWSIAEVYLY